MLNKKSMSKEEKQILKENNLIKKFVKYKESNKEKNVYLTKGTLRKKFKNSQTFINANYVNDKGIIKLRSNEYARVFSVDAVDLSLSSSNQKQSFFEQLSYLFQIRELNLRIYKLDDRIDLYKNRDYYSKLIEKFQDDEEKLEFLTEKYNELLELDQDEDKVTSRYYFVVVNEDEKILEHVVEELQLMCDSMTPKLNIELMINKLEIYQFLINLYMSSADIEQLMWSDLSELITPFFVKEYGGFIKVDSEEIQIVSIRAIPPFIDNMFFEDIFNVAGTRCCIHIKDTIPTEEIVRRLDSNYEFLLSERNTTRKLSDATQMDVEKESFQALMNQIKNGDEKIKEISLVIVIKGTKKEREEKLNKLKTLAKYSKIKLEVPYMRQMEGWQAYDINKNGFEDYNNYLPTLTIGASFPLTITNFNDETGYYIGEDIHTKLPTIIDIFHKDTTRPSHNMAVIALSGGGKSFTLKKMIINEVNRGNKCFLFDAEGEYEKLVRKNKGEYIDLYSSSGGIINPLQVRFLPSDDEEKNINEITKINFEDCPLAKHLSSLETFIKCVYEEINESEVVVMLDMIEKLYNRFGITKNTKIANLEKLENTDYPIFSDLISFLPEYRKMITNPVQLKIVDKLEILLDRFNVGIDAMLFNGYTSVNLDSDLIAFNVKDLLYSKNKRIITTQLVNLLTYFNNIIVKNKIVNDRIEDDMQRQYMAIIVDEFHLYLKNTDSDVLLTFEQIARIIRKYHGSFIPATQSIHDFIGNDDSVRSATAIFNNCQYQLVGMMKEEDLSTYLKLFYQKPLTDTQQEFLMKAEQGEFLLTIDSKNRIRVKVTSTPKEIELMGEEI